MNALVNYPSISNCNGIEKLWNKIPCNWMTKKKQDDNIGGLWRVHDALYDVTKFIHLHPGGKFWLENTKGTDITEAFECHHVKSDQPEQTLRQFFVRKASHPRLSRYTFREDGFYKTLKRKVQKKLKTLPSRNSKISSIYIYSLLIASFFFASLGNAAPRYIFIFLSGLFSSFLMVASHNFAHQADNIEMYMADIFYIPARLVRHFHVFSHHMFPNTELDLHLTIAEPTVNYFPNKKSIVARYWSWLYSPILVWPFLLHYVKIIDTVERIMKRWLDIAYFLPLVMPLTMHVFGGHSILATFLTWQLITIHASIFFYFIMFTANHLHPDIYMQGDTIRPDDQFDWGINQLDTVSDREGLLGNKFLSLILFGDHALHHLFPTLDQCVLQDLYPILEETLEEFNLGNIRIQTQVDLIYGFYKRVMLEVPNSNPPSLK